MRGDLGGEQPDAGGDAVVVCTALGDIGFVVLEGEIDVVPFAGLGLSFGFVGPGGGDSEGVGYRVGGVGNLQDLCDTGPGGGSQMGSGEPGDGSVPGFPPAVGGRGVEKAAA